MPPAQRRTASSRRKTVSARTSKRRTPAPKRKAAPKRTTATPTRRTSAIEKRIARRNLLARRALAIGAAVLIVTGIVFVVVKEEPPAYADELGCAATAPLKEGSVPGGWYDDVVVAAKSSGLPAPILAAQLDQESRWDPKAVSHAGAQGLAQFRPDTWDEYGAGGDPFDPEDAIKAQGKFMAWLIESVTLVAGSGGAHPVVLALAAYNAGPTAVAKYGGVPPFAETEHYVKVIPQMANSTYAEGCD